MSAAEVHGLQRLWIGFDVVEVVAEYNALRAALLDFYERHSLSLAGHSAYIVNEVIDTAIALAMKSYADEKVAELQRFRAERLSFVTHDLKTPLSAIHAAAHVLETRINSLDENTQRKMFIEFAFDHFIARLYDKLQLVVRQFAEIVINDGAGLLQDAKRANHLARHHVKANIEMKQRALGLRAPVAICEYLDGPHRVGFYSGFSGLFRG